MSALAVTHPLTPSFVPQTPPVLEPSRDWASLVVELFKKVMSDNFETASEFEKDIKEIYLGMSQVLMRTYDGKNPLAAHKETIEKATSELYQTIVAAKKGGKTEELFFSEIVSSVVFQSLVPVDQGKQYSADPTSWEFIFQKLVPLVLKETPRLKDDDKVRKWLTSAYFFTVKKADLDKQRTLLGAIPEDVTARLMPIRREIGAFVLTNFNKRDLSELVEIIKDPKVKEMVSTKKIKVVETAERYLILISLAKDEKGDYSEALRQSLLVGFETLSAKLPGDPVERKA